MKRSAPPMRRGGPAGKSGDQVARNYAALLHEYLEEMDILSDAEFGRLCRALLQYSVDGREVQLEGAEKVLWKRVKKQEDRFQESYEEKSESRRNAGKKGAAKRWQSMADDGTAIGSDGVAMAEDGIAKNGIATDSSAMADDGKPWQAIASDSKNSQYKTKTETNIPPPIGGRDTRPRVKTPPPTFEQVLEKAKLMGCPECAKPFFDYYAAAEWRDSEGKPCAWNWQQKLVAWQMREEKRRKNQKPPFGGKVSAAPEDPNAVRRDMERMEEYRRKLREEAGKEEES